VLLGQPALPGRHGEVVLEERLDGSLWAHLDGILHPVVPAPERPVILREQALFRSSAARPTAPPPPTSTGAAILPFNPGDKVAGSLSGQIRWPSTRVAAGLVVSRRGWRGEVNAPRRGGAGAPGMRRGVACRAAGRIPVSVLGRPNAVGATAGPGKRPALDRYLRYRDGGIR